MFAEARERFSWGLGVMGAVLVFVAPLGARAQDGDGEGGSAAGADGGGEERMEAVLAEIQGALRALAEEVAGDEEVDLPEDRAEAEKMLEQLDEQQARGRFLEFALEYLAEVEPGERYPYFLWRYGAYVEWAELDEASPYERPVLAEVLELGMRLPRSSPYHYETLFLRSKQLGREGDREGQIALLERALGERQFPDRFRISFRQSLGEAWEREGNAAKAREAYRPLVADAAGSKAAARACLRLVLLALEDGEFGEARAVLGELVDLPAAVLEATPGGAQLGDLIAQVRLFGEGEEIQRWTSAGEWWPLWEEFEDKVGLDEPAEGEGEGEGAGEGDGIELLVLEDLERLVAAVTRAAAGRDVKEFVEALRPLAGAARWSEEMALRLSSALAPQGAKTFGNHSEALIDLSLAVVEQEFQVRGLERRRLFQRCVVQLDGGRPEDALATAEAFGKEPQPEDDISHAMMRFWGLAALRAEAELERPAAALEGLLGSGARVADRAATVATLADLYHQGGKYDEEEALLERELAHPDIRADDALREPLRQRLETLITQFRPAREMAAAVGRWLGDEPPLWYRLAGPETLASLEDEEGITIEALMADPSVLPEAKATRVFLLAAADPSLPFLVQQDSFSRAFAGMLGRTRTFEEAREWTERMLAEEGIPERLRSFLLGRALLEAVVLGDPGAAELAEHPLISWPDSMGNPFAFSVRLAQVDRGDVGQIEELAKEIAGDPVESGGASILMQCLDWLLSAGELEAAGRVADLARSVDFAPSYRAEGPGFLLRVERLTRAAEGLVELNGKLRGLVLEAIPKEGIERPEGHPKWRGAEVLDTLAEEKSLAERLWLIREGRIHLMSPEFWHTFLTDIHHVSDHHELAKTLISALISEDPDDLRGSFTMLRASELVDVDNPDDRAFLLGLAAEYRGSEERPLTAQMAEYAEAQITMRAGERPEVIPGAGTREEHPLMGVLAARLEINRAWIHDGKEELAAVLGKLDPDLLMGDNMVSTALPAFRAAGLEAEARAAEVAATQVMEDGVLDAAFHRDPSSALRALRLAIDLGREDAVGDEWIEEMEEVGSPLRRWSLGIEAGVLRGDWASVEKNAREAIERYPTFYFLYWHLGQALVKLDRREEAIEPLELYAKMSGDEVESLQARAWLAEIRGEGEAEEAEEAPEGGAVSGGEG